MITKVCRRCRKEAPHRKRSDSSKPRSLCTACDREEIANWRKKNWQRRKLRDTWRGMIARCHDRSRRRWDHCPAPVPRYADYGARGITVCERWHGRKGFLRFVAHVGLPPSPDSTLDRIDTNKGYAPGNVRWAGVEVQRANRCNTVWLEAHDPESGELLKLSISDWARRVGITRRALSERLRRGWENDRAVSTPSRTRGSAQRGDAWEPALNLAVAQEVSASCPF